MLQSSLIQKLEKLVERQQELYALMADPDVINDQNRFRNLGKEAAEVSPVAKCFNDYQDNLNTIKTSKGMLKDKDNEIRLMAADELKLAEIENTLLEI